jgi:hypothetical protein
MAKLTTADDATTTVSQTSARVRPTKALDDRPLATVALLKTAISRLISPVVGWLMARIERSPIAAVNSRKVQAATRSRLAASAAALIWKALRARRRRPT